jgi:hypothetical protein
MNTQALETEAAFSDIHYAPFKDDLSINEGMFQKYANPYSWSDWQPVPPRSNPLELG